MTERIYFIVLVSVNKTDRLVILILITLLIAYNLQCLQSLFMLSLIVLC